MPECSTNIDRVFRALGDPTRLAVVARLASGPTSATELARPFDMALASFTQHLGVLESSGLIISRKIGRSRIYELQQQKLNAANDWLAAQRHIWNQRLDQLDAFLLATKETRS